MNLLKPVEEESKNSLTLDLITNISGVIGEAIIGDPTGIAAAVIPRIINEVIHRIINPLTSPSESKRVYQWGKQAAEGIACRLENGEEFRKDGFFKETPTNRSNFEEVVESTLKMVMDATEEPKIKFMANLTENVHFDKDLDMDTYRRVLKYLDELSYRQLSIIKMCKNADNIDVESLGNTEVTTKLGSILGDFFELRDKGFIASNSPIMIQLDKLYVGSSGDYATADSRSAELSGFANQDGFFDFPSDILFKFADLDKIPDKDVDAIEQILKK